MPNSTIFRRIELTEDYRPLSAERLVGTVEISSPPHNPGLVFFKGDTGDDVEVIAGETHLFKNVDLAQIHARGEPGSVLTIIGGTWRE